MKRKKYLVLAALFFIISQSGFAGALDISKNNNNSDAPGLFVLSKSKQDNLRENNAADNAAREKARLEQEGDNSVNSYQPYLQVGGTRFFNVRSKAAAGFDFFIPLWQSPSELVFSDIRFYDRSGKPFEGNLHLGYRHLSPDSENLYGIYGAFDRKRSELGNYFNQLTFGAEFWHKNLFIGGNYYQPIGSKSKSISNQESASLRDAGPVYKNIWITESQQDEKAMRGADAEVGYEFIRGLTGYVGGYYFKAKNTPTVFGPKAKLSYDWSLDNGKRILGIFDKFGLEAGIQKDKSRGTTGYISANFRVGLLTDKQSNLQGVARHMIDLVQRDVDVVSGKVVTESQYPHKNKRGEDAKLIEVEDLGELKEAAKGEADYISVNGTIETDVDSLGDNFTGNLKTKELIYGRSLLITSNSGKTLLVDVGGVGRIRVTGKDERREFKEEEQKKNADAGSGLKGDPEPLDKHETEIKGYKEKYPEQATEQAEPEEIAAEEKDLAVGAHKSDKGLKGAWLESWLITSAKVIAFVAGSLI